MNKRIINRVAQRILFTAGIILWASIAACSDDKAQDFDAFKQFADALSYIYFPYNQETLDNCRAEKEKQCINTFNSALQAKKTLFKNGHSAALTATLDAITQHCKGGKRTDDLICNGALLFLYYFNDKDSDTKIIDYLSTATRDTIQTIFEAAPRQWLINRPDNSKWVSFVKSTKKLEDAKKPGYINIITKASDYDHALKLIKANTSISK